MNQILNALKAVAEPTRLRLLALCGCAELSVGELVEIIGQSQPRISRHLKLLVEGGLLERAQEGSFVFYRLHDRGAMVDLARSILDNLPTDDAVLDQDAQALALIRQKRDQQVRDFFAENAENWDEMRSLHVDMKQVDSAFEEIITSEHLGRVVDLGCGDGHVMKLVASLTDHATGIDVQPEMLRVARNTMDKLGKPGFHVQQADICRLPFVAESFDTASIFMALRHIKDPSRAITEAGRVLTPGGRLIIVDFAAHNLVSLKEKNAHQWLGFQSDQVEDWFVSAKLEPIKTQAVYHGVIPVMIWSARKMAA